MVPHGAVTTVDARCTAAAINGLKMGANAVDAAIIASLCAGIVRPQIAGIGGFVYIHLTN
jgi:gamma-glutamyltranspeptidase